jgi:hypothetical protein
VSPPLIGGVLFAFRNLETAHRDPTAVKKILLAERVMKKIVAVIDWPSTVKNFNICRLGQSDRHYSVTKNPGKLPAKFRTSPAFILSN